MEQKKELTKTLLANSLKTLLVSKPFDKITIKMITDEAGVIRPTFYNYFQDKYELLEWIFQKDIAEKVDLMLDNHMEAEAIKLFFVCLEKEFDFYKRAILITGQNSFCSILNTYIYNSFLTLLDKYTILLKDYPMLTIQMIAKFYSFGLFSTIQTWLLQPDYKHLNASEVYEAYYFLIQHSFLDFISKKR